MITGTRPGKGNYTCTDCGKDIMLDQDSDRLPPCKKCNGTRFTPKITDVFPIRK